MEKAEEQRLPIPKAFSPSAFLFALLCSVLSNLIGWKYDVERGSEGTSQQKAIGILHHTI